VPNAPGPAPHIPHRLYLLFLPRCETCAAAKPLIHAWIAKHSEVKLVEVDLEKTPWRAERWTPKEVPTLILLTPQGKNFIRRYKEPLEQWAEGLDAWVKKLAPGAWIEDAQVSP
jgi:hypothetical protein